MKLAWALVIIGSPALRAVVALAGLCLGHRRGLKLALPSEPPTCAKGSGPRTWAAAPGAVWQGSPATRNTRPRGPTLSKVVQPGQAASAREKLNRVSTPPSLSLRAVGRLGWPECPPDRGGSRESPLHLPFTPETQSGTAALSAAMIVITKVICCFQKREPGQESA